MVTAHLSLWCSGEHYLKEFMLGKKDVSDSEGEGEWVGQPELDML